MPHRTVFQWGKNHAHPFTVFIGGLVIGALVTGAIMYAWGIANDINDNVDQVIVVPVTKNSPAPAASESPSASPSANTEVQF